MDPDSREQNVKKALETGQAAEEEELGLLFEIGNALELLKRNNDALVYYEKVEEGNPEFRDVSARIERLGNLTSGGGVPGATRWDLNTMAIGSKVNLPHSFGTRIPTGPSISSGSTLLMLKK